MKYEYPILPDSIFTATIYEWKHSPENDKHKDIIIESVGFTSSIIQASFMKIYSAAVKASLTGNDENTPRI